MAPDAAKNVLEAARATALAAHCAAGLAASAGLRPAERLLRTAEALSRSAIAALTCPPQQPPAKAAVVPSARARRRRNKKQNEKMDVSVMPMDLPQSPATTDDVYKVVLVAQPSVLSAAATGFVPGPTRILKPRTSRERSPRRGPSPSAVSDASAPAGMASSSAGNAFFTVGQEVLLGVLGSRPEVTGSAVILSYDSVTDRYAVTVDATGERIKVKEVNLRAPS